MGNIEIERDTLSSTASELNGTPEEYLSDKAFIETQIGEIEASWTGAGLNISEAASDFAEIRKALSQLEINLNRVATNLSSVSSAFNGVVYRGRV